MRTPIQFSLPFGLAARWLCVCAWLSSALVAQQNLTITGSQCNSSQQAVNSITTSGTCTVSGSVSVKYEAGGSIVLMPGFSAQASGSNTFDAVIISQAVAPALTSPAAGASGPALTPQVFTLTFSDTLGSNDVNSFQVSFGGTGAIPGICSLSYAGGVLGLWSDNATQLITTPPLQNSQCSAGSYQATGAGTTLTFTVPITFLTSFEGGQEVYALAVSSSGDYHPWVDLGAWTVTAPTTQTQIFSSPGTYTWTAPTGVTSIQVESWGPGGTGANTAFFSSYGCYTSGGGGGGGAYAKKTSATVTPGQQYSVVVGAGGSTTKTTFAGSVVVADYGVNGAQATSYSNAGIGGSGGQAANSAGDVTQSGTSGGNGGDPYGGAGGAGADGGPGGLGSDGNGYPGAAPGGAGAGASGHGCTNGGPAYTGGAGANGQVVLTYSGPAGTTTYTIGGQVTASGAGLSGVAIALTGSQTATVTTDANGNYSLFSLPAGGNYTVTGSKSGYALSAAQSFTNLAASQTASFTATQSTTYTITGQVTVAGSGLSGVSIALGGSQSGSTSTDANGNYSLPNLSAGGNYTVTASKSGYTLSGAQTFTNLAANQTANFTASTGPTISSIQTPTEYLSTTAVTVTWSTSTNANSQICWGTTLPYPNCTALDATLTQTHQQYILGLSPNVTYHYQVRSTDQSGNLSVSQDLTFATPATPPPVPTDFTSCVLGTAASCTLNPGTYVVNSTINVSRYGVALSGGTADSVATRLVRGSSFTGQMVRVNVTDSSGQTLTMSQAGKATGVVIENLTFCGGANTHPGTNPNTPLAVASPLGSPCGDQHAATSACGYGGSNPVCTDLAVESADSGDYLSNPFDDTGNRVRYAVELNNIDLEDAAGHALMLWATAAPNSNNDPPRKVNDIWIHDSAIKYSAITGIGIGVNNVIYTNKYIDSYGQHNPYAFRDDPALFAPRNIRIEGRNTIQFNNTGSTFGGAVRWLGIRDNNYYVNYISPPLIEENAGGYIAISASSDKVEISGNTFTGPNPNTGMPPSPPPGYTSHADTSALEIYASNVSIHDNTITGYGYQGIGAFSLFQSTISNNHILPDNNWLFPSGGIDIGNNFPGSACEDVPRDTNALMIQTNDSNGLLVGPATQAYGILLEDHQPTSTDRLIGVTVTADNFQGDHPLFGQLYPVFLQNLVGLYAYSGAPYTLGSPQTSLPRFLPIDVPSASSSTFSFSPLWPVPPRCPELQPPPAGSSNGSSRAKFTFSASDPNGAANIVAIWGLFSVGGSDTDPSSPVIVASAPDQGLCYFMYDAVNNLVYLYNVYLDNGNGGWLGPSAIGSSDPDLATPGGCIIHAGSSTSWLSLGRPQAVPTAYVHDLTLDVTLPTSQTNKYHLYGYTENLNYNFDACGTYQSGTCPAWRYWGYWWNTQ